MAFCAWRNSAGGGHVDPSPAAVAREFPRTGQLSGPIGQSFFGLAGEVLEGITKCV